MGNHCRWALHFLCFSYSRVVQRCSGVSFTSITLWWDELEPRTWRGVLGIHSPSSELEESGESIPSRYAIPTIHGNIPSNSQKKFEPSKLRVSAKSLHKLTKETYRQKWVVKTPPIPPKFAWSGFELGFQTSASSWWRETTALELKFR